MIARRFGFVSLISLMSAVPALAADWSEDYGMRPSYSQEPSDWTELGAEDDVTFEFGVRYSYSWGAQNFTISGGEATTEDQTQALEAHARMDDWKTNTFADAIAAYAFSMRGSYESGGFASGTIDDGRMTLLGGDVGWYAFGDAAGGVGPQAGYLFWNDSPRTDRVNFTDATSGDDLQYDPNTGQIFFTGDSSDTNIDIHAIKVGLAARAVLGEMVDITAEANAIPYAYMSGILGNHSIPTLLTPLGNPAFVKTSETSATGWGYGASGEIMVGFRPFENAVFRVGGRAMYLQGTYDATYTAAQISDPVDSDANGIYDEPPVFVNQGYIETANPFSLFRYGLLAEATYQF